jgi:hypothetical protein
MKPIEEERTREIKEVGIENAKSVWYSNETENLLYSYKQPIFQFASFQIILTFIFCLSGLYLTQNRKLFKRLSLTFGILTILVVLAYFIAAIIPYGMVT